MTTSRQSGRKSKNVTPAASKSQGRPAGAASSTNGQPPAPEQVSPAGAYSWTHDYDYVKSDLRKLLVVSAILFVAIIVAGFFI